MKSTKKILAAMCALTFCLSAAACGDEDSSGAANDGTTTTTGTTEPPKQLGSEDLEAVSSMADELEDIDFENKTLIFYSHWDINPSEGSVVGADIQMFRDKYKGEFKMSDVDWDNRWADLGKLVGGGKAPDFFSAMDMDAFPRGAVLDIFQPIDEYLDVTTERWASAREINDMFMLNGKHYVAATGAEPDVVCIYNTKTMKDNGFDDPWELYKKGEWTFSKFSEMCKEFTNQDEEKVGLDGWWYEKGLLHQCGLPVITCKDGKVATNIKEPAMIKMADAMYELGKADVVFHSGCRGGGNGDPGLGTHQTLFWPCGMWGIEGTPASKDALGDITAGEVALCPMPRADDSDKHYMTARVTGYVLCKNAPNPKLWAAYMNCRMVTADKGTDIYERTLTDEYGWNETMIEQRRECFKLANENPVFEFNGAVSAELSAYWDNGETGCNFERWTLNRWGDPVTFTQMTEEHFNEVQAFLDQANAKIAG